MLNEPVFSLFPVIDIPQGEFSQNDYAASQLSHQYWLYWRFFRGVYLNPLGVTTTEAKLAFLFIHFSAKSPQLFYFVAFIDFSNQTKPQSEAKQKIIIFYLGLTPTGWLASWKG